MDSISIRPPCPLPQVRCLFITTVDDEHSYVLSGRVYEKCAAVEYECDDQLGMSYVFIASCVAMGRG